MIELKLLLTEAEAQELEQALLVDAVHIQLLQRKQEDASPYHVEREKTLETLTVKFLAATAT